MTIRLNNLLDKISSVESQIRELTGLMKSNEVSAIQGTNNFNRDSNIRERANNTGNQIILKPKFLQ